MALGTKRAAWRSVLFAHSALIRIFEAELKHECGTPLQTYDVLIRIWLAPGQSMRMSELADSAILSRSWITRRVERLEADGLVERTPAGDDGRGVSVRLSDQGRETFGRLERSHAKSIDQHFSRFMTEDEARVLTDVLNRVTVAANGGLGAPAKSPVSRA
jgi:DNA-binding MarR family transcriptional regulator